MAVVGNNKMVFMRLLKTFSSNTLCDEFISALKAGDSDLAKSKVHALKGVCGNMRFDKVFEILKAIEAEMKVGKALGPNDELVVDLLSAHANTMETVNLLIGNPDMLSIA